MGQQIFANRADAGRQLAGALEQFRDDHPVVLALPRGGLPVAWEVARALDCPLDILLVRKIGVPWQPELAVAAVVGSDPPECVLNDEVLAQLPVPQNYIREERDRQVAEIERRRRLYTGGRPAVSLEGRTVIVVDDGIATGTTIRAALKGLRRSNPMRIVLAIPVAPPDVIERLRSEADEIVALSTPRPFHAVGMHYKDFDQLSDDEVIRVLEAAAQRGGDRQPPTVSTPSAAPEGRPPNP